MEINTNFLQLFKNEFTEINRKLDYQSKKLNIVESKIENNNLQLLSMLFSREFNSNFSSLLSISFVKFSQVEEEFKIFEDVTINNIIELIGDKKGSYIVGHLGKIILNNSELGNSNIKLIIPSTSILGNLGVNGERSETNIFYTHPLLLNEATKKTEQICIINKFISYQVLLTNELLNELAQKVSSRLILTVDTFNRNKEILVFWESGFSGVESDGDKFFRWNMSSDKEGQISIVNKKSESIEVKVEFECETLDGDAPWLQINGSGIEKNVKLNKTENIIIINVTLLKGKNTLNFIYYGESIKPRRDSRYLNFAVKNLKIRSINSNQIMNSEEVYFESELPEENTLEDSFIRRKLHNAGFFEVYGYGYANNGFIHRKLPKTRSLIPNDFYLYESGDERIESPVDYHETLFYIANRAINMENSHER